MGEKITQGQIDARIFYRHEYRRVAFDFNGPMLMKAIGYSLRFVR
jgi:hypothetical protein